MTVRGYVDLFPCTQTIDAFSFLGRHFVKDDLRRIQYTNPDLKIHVEKRPKTIDEHWKPEMVLELCTSLRNL